MFGVWYYANMLRVAKLRAHTTKGEFMDEVESLRQEISQLSEQLAAQAAKIETMYEAVWAANVLTGLLPRLIPTDQAWDAAQSIQTELELVPPEQLASHSGRWLCAVRKNLLQRSSVPAHKS